MREIYLSLEEKTQALRYLSQSSRAGGWVFLLLIAAIPFLILLAVAFNIIPASENWTSDDTALFIFWFLAGAVPGIWLLRYKRKIAAWLEAPLRPITAVVTHISVLPYAGCYVELTWEAADGTQTGRMRYPAQPQLETGQSIDLLQLPDGRFFPRHPTQAVDFGRIETPARRTRRRLVIGCTLSVFLLLTTIGFLIGFFNQG